MQKIEKDEEYFNKIRAAKEAENKEKLSQTNRRLESEFHRTDNNVIEKFKGETKQ
jgi:hemin uptake protein HemP